MKKLVLALIATAVLAGCKTSPTGRTQIALYSDQQMSEMGTASFADMKKNQPINKDPKTNTYVNCIANKVIAVLPNEYASQNWEVVVFEDDSANAFALPGGYIGVHTGLLKIATNQDQVATVLGHEVGHVIAEHSNERVSQSSLLSTGMQLGSVALEMGNVQYRNEIMQGLGLGAQYGVVLPFSRSHESEADTIGLELMAQAGFNPKESVTLWQNMSQAGSGATPEFLSTHPAPTSRIANLQSQMTKALSKQNSANSQGKRPQCTL
ncbi:MULTISPECIES: M48 family metallopeptidase [unclassified Pseudoalteromonas]|uniref:M48 family metallopeptidase n=1 Tax=unclassified Pseudoalteromonas TaxID=194690 RepID=UPI0007310F5A|nr:MULTISPECIES: M48 family metallopeptidase [unclassified Pseudoalteromonas]KTD97741.1 peptidase [Pseudoalteromonas sp. H71]MBW4965478.1 M48 family metallopeptidase [Pseudoalteromonas sp. CR1]TMN76877.1 M48 family peptidase [Pseudoalteromonas sp. S410]TMN88038.1 M48 family peptidase [Pseudoalteromonas sp. S408]TMN95456.1 M48 family peptidase [Pseudoalteromonas sp. S407]|tara:strand:+ start:192 stop:989 length:798 start_codon:yes stop_codon:yes gene_type:complete